MIKSLFNRIKIALSILSSDEFFVVTANKSKKYSSQNPPILYEYETNTDRELFFIFVKHYLNDNYGRKQ